MIYHFYNILLTFLLILVSPYFLLRSLFQNHFRKDLIQRMGFLPRLSLKRPIWVHAASVGEVLCCIPLLKRVKEDFPHSRIIMTTMTRTGHETAKAQIPEVEAVLLFPIDHPLIIHKVMARIQPSLLLIAETELWPSLLQSCGKKGVPIIVFNGRISKKSFRRYLLFKFFFKECLKYISLFLMQTDEDQKRIIAIGGESQKTRAVGNLKFDQTSPSFTSGGMNEMTNTLGIHGNENILIAGSTHSGEEEILVNLFKELKKMDPHLILILAPRHLERLEEVERILKKESISWLRKTSLSLISHRSDQDQPKVILLDTMGELMGIYSIGTLVFIGGSLVPIGGHNPLEPLFFRKCVLFGPFMHNFLEISSLLTEAGGAIQVTGRDDLFSQLTYFLSNEKARKEVGEKGYRFLRKHQGATERMMNEIRPFLFQIQNSEF